MNRSDIEAAIAEALRATPRIGGQSSNADWATTERQARAAVDAILARFLIAEPPPGMNGGIVEVREAFVQGEYDLYRLIPADEKEQT